MAYIHTINLGEGQRYLIEPKLFATAGGTSTALTAGISDFELFPGAYVYIKVGTVGANATLNVNSTGMKDIYYKGAQINADALTDGNIYTFIYDGTNWNIIGDITGKNVMIGTTAEWAQKVNYSVPQGTILVYTDHGTYNKNGTTITVPGIKISDGLAYVNSLPFVGDDVAAAIRAEMDDHVKDMVRHITSEERSFWNNKLNCEITGENLLLNRL